MFKGLLKFALRGIAFGAGLLGILALLPTVYAASLSLLTGPAGTNPSYFPSDMPDINTLITNLNANLFAFLTLDNSTAEAGELALSSQTAFAVNASVATAMSSVGPSGSHTTIQEWLVVIDNNGNQRFAPLF